MKRISEVGKLTGISRRALQFYDREGLLSVERTKNNYRLYDQAALERIWRILLYKQMGFELAEIKEILMASEEQQAEYLKKRMEAVKGQVGKLNKLLEFISFVQENGIPPVPAEAKSGTYRECVVELWEQIYAGKKCKETKEKGKEYENE